MFSHAPSPSHTLEHKGDVELVVNMCLHVLIPRPNFTSLHHLCVRVIEQQRRRQLICSCWMSAETKNSSRFFLVELTAWSFTCLVWVHKRAETPKNKYLFVNSVHIWTLTYRKNPQRVTMGCYTSVSLQRIKLHVCMLAKSKLEYLNVSLDLWTPFNTRHQCSLKLKP